MADEDSTGPETPLTVRLSFALLTNTRYRLAYFCMSSYFTVRFPALRSSRSCTWMVLPVTESFWPDSRRLAGDKSVGRAP